MQRASSTKDSSAIQTPNSLEDSLSSYDLEKSNSKSSDDKRQGKWLPSEDELLKKYVDELGERQWQKISKNIPGRTSIQCLHRWSKILKPGLTKGPWTAEEDLKLMAWVKEHGATQWTKAGEQITGRSGKQCRERWFNSLNPDVKKGGWTTEEDQLIFDLYQQHGSSWSKIAKQLPGRSENSVKNRFYSTLRKTDAVIGLNKNPSDPLAIDCKRMVTDDTNRSTQMGDSDRKDSVSDDEMGGRQPAVGDKRENTLFNLLKRSYSEQKVALPGDRAKKFNLNKTKGQKNSDIDINLAKGGLKLEGESQDGKSVRSDEKLSGHNDLNLAKRYNSCQPTTHELEDLEKIQKKLFTAQMNSNVATGNMFGNHLLAGMNAGNLFGNGLGGLGFDNLLTNPLIAQLKNQENQRAVPAFNSGLFMGLDPLSLNLQTNALFANNLSGLNAFSGLNALNNPLQGLSSFPLINRSPNQDEPSAEANKSQAKSQIKEEHDHREHKPTNNILTNGLSQAALLSGNNNIENLLAFNNLSMLYNNQLQNLMGGFGGLPVRNGAGLNNKNAFQQFPFSALQ